MTDPLQTRSRAAVWGDAPHPSRPSRGDLVLCVDFTLRTYVSYVICLSREVGAKTSRGNGKATMRKIVLLASMLFMILMTAPPAMAALAGNAPLPPDLALDKNGQIVVGGDVVFNGGGIGNVVGGDDCPSLTQYIKKYGKPSNKPGAQYELYVKHDPNRTGALVDLCKQPNTSLSNKMSKDKSTDSTNRQGGAMLPDTGGSASLALFLAPGLLLVGAGLIASRRVGR